MIFGCIYLTYPGTLLDYDQDGLAVHKKKVEDVAKWLHEALDGSPNLRKYRVGHDHQTRSKMAEMADRSLFILVAMQRLLALTGPAGSGKTALMRVLSSRSELDFELVEWSNSAVVSGSSDYVDGGRK